MRDEYRSIANKSTMVLKVEGSKFIASAFPAGSRPGAEKFLESLRKKYFDATHHCYAYAFGSEREEFRYSDDGEPSGTAGVKIFSAIQSLDLSDILVVVTRYFGGTKLGVGGLGRAYFDSAIEVLRSAEVVAKIVGEEIHITFPYAETNGVMNILSRCNARIIDTVYDDDVVLSFSVRKGLVAAVGDDLTNVTRGNISIKHSSSSPH